MHPPRPFPLSHSQVEQQGDEDDHHEPRECGVEVNDEEEDHHTRQCVHPVQPVPAGAFLVVLVNLSAWEGRTGVLLSAPGRREGEREKRESWGVSLCTGDEGEGEERVVVTLRDWSIGVPYWTEEKGERGRGRWQHCKKGEEGANSPSGMRRLLRSCDRL